MAGMQRFITYIYAYENGTKQYNTGFAKVEIRGDDVRLEIHLKNAGTRKEEGTVALFWEKEGMMESLPIGKMKIVNGIGDYGTVMKADKIGSSPHSFIKMEGILILGEEGSLFLSRWKEGKPIEVVQKNIYIWGQEREQKPKDEGQQPVKSKQPLQQINMPAVSEDKKTDIEQEEENIQATEVPMRNIFPQYNWLEVWETLKATHPVYELNSGILCVRIELKDLRELPKKYWYLGNNSFLLHGFFNYRYLMIGKLERDRWFLGVPGIYQHQERIMAAIFGFPEFLPVNKVEGAEEKQTDEEPLNQFGYWFHTLEE